MSRPFLQILSSVRSKESYTLLLSTTTPFHFPPLSTPQQKQQQQQQGHAPSLRHVKQGSVPSLLFRSRDEGGNRYQPAASAAVARSKSDAAGRRSKAASTFYVGFQGLVDSAAEVARITHQPSSHHCLCFINLLCSLFISTYTLSYTLARLPHYLTRWMSGLLAWIQWW